MNELLIVLFTALLFVVLGLLTRERRPSDDACGGCSLECDKPEVPHARS